jgi:hypothetical protein
MIDTYPKKNGPGAVEQAFRQGHGIAVPWGEASGEVARAMGVVERYLSTFEVEESFAGADGLKADRQTLWVASTGLGGRLHERWEAIARFDGDEAGGSRGLETLERDAGAREALLVLKEQIDRALRLAVEGLHLHEDLPAEIVGALTVRYRAIRYAPVEREVAGIGIHPDGNVISALVTDQPGLVVLDGQRIARPAPEAGTILMPGSILARWSDMALPPVVHTVEIRRGDPTKFTMVGFLNFPDEAVIPRSSRFTANRAPFHNRIKELKPDDMNAGGDLAGFYRSRGFVTGGEGAVRFHTLPELEARAAGA